MKKSGKAIIASERRDSNSRHSRWQRDALPAELLSHSLNLHLCYLSDNSVFGNISKNLFFLK